MQNIVSQFAIRGTVNEIKPLGEGLINDTYKVTTVEADEIMTEVGVKGIDRKKYVDKIAAMIILQDYMDSKKTGV